MMMDVISWLGISDAKHIPATITGVLGFASVALTGFAAIFAWLTKQYLLRREKRNDLRAAIRAEIEVQWLMLKKAPNQEETIPIIEKKLRTKGNKDYSPHFSRYPGPEIFGSIKAEIAALGREEIPLVVQFYHHLAVMDNFVIELRSTEFKSYDRDRKLLMIKDMFRMVEQATILAEKSMIVLEDLMNISQDRRLCARKAELERDNQMAT